MANGEADDGKYSNGVFLSVAEDDTKNFPFIRNTIDALRRHGLDIFPSDVNKSSKASEEVQRSRLAMIEKVRVAVVFLSPNYASSAARLDELVKICACAQSSRKLVVCPIFCDVEPHDVRHQKGSYEQAIAALEKDSDDKRVRGWRSALLDIACYSGVIVRRSRPEYEAMQMLLDWINKHCTSNFDYDVFISFCGEDQSCYSFTGFLYKALRQQRFHIFFRYDRLKSGNHKVSPSNYIQAINRAKVSIIVFSESYASDEACLNELSMILKCKRLRKQQVFPVFYNLEPSHVRYQTSSYELAMKTLENRYGKDHVQQFVRSALFEVANLKGWTFKSGLAYEYQTIHKIVELVNKSLPRYDVFLSFRGMDTRFTFTGHLYNDLCKKGFKTFMDDDAMKYGEEISSSLATAIEKSRVAVVIFSENYAYSPWTLEELAIILDLKQVKNYHVYPIYYKVNQEDVWNQEGSYGEAMAKHEKRYPEKVQRWREALSRVHEFDPMLMELDEYDLIERIANKVQECLR